MKLHFSDSIEYKDEISYYEIKPDGNDVKSHQHDVQLFLLLETTKRMMHI